MINNGIFVKPYEPIDDEGLKDLCISNMYDTQVLTRGVLIRWAITVIGWRKIIIILSFLLSISYTLLLEAGFNSNHSLCLSCIGWAFLLIAFYGMFVPWLTMCYGCYYAKVGVEKDFSDIQKNFMTEKKHFWIATQKAEEAKERVVGCVLVEPYDWETDALKLADCKEEMGEVTELRRMSVARDLRRRNIGLGLISKLRQFCVENGYKTVVLNTLANNTAAINLYKKAGFEISKINYQFFGVIAFGSVTMTMKLKENKSEK